MTMMVNGTNYLVLIEASNNMVMLMVILEILGLLKVILIVNIYILLLSLIINIE